VQGVKLLARKISKVWDSLELDDLAEQIIDLEGKASRLDVATPGAEKVQRLAEHLHFKFVFPIVAEVEGGFAKEIKRSANDVLAGSPDAFNELNARQQAEIMRQMGRKG
jgi:hypothetical protein